MSASQNLWIMLGNPNINLFNMVEQSIQIRLVFSSEIRNSQGFQEMFLKSTKIMSGAFSRSSFVLINFKENITMGYYGKLESQM